MWGGVCICLFVCLFSHIALWCRTRPGCVSQGKIRSQNKSNFSKITYLEPILPHYTYSPWLVCVCPDGNSVLARVVSLREGKNEFLWFSPLSKLLPCSHSFLLLLLYQASCFPPAAAAAASCCGLFCLMSRLPCTFTSSLHGFFLFSMRENDKYSVKH